MNLRELVYKYIGACEKPLGIDELDRFHDQYRLSSSVIDYPNYYRLLFYLSGYINTYVELGCYRGWAALHAVHSGANAEIIDIRSHLCDEAVNHPKISFNLGRSVEAKFVNKFDDGSVDILLIDSDHTYDTTKREYEIWEPKVRNGGLILFDDVDHCNYGCGTFYRELSNRLDAPQLHDGGWGFGIIFINRT